LFQWAPDVYEGAPTPITAFLAVGSKAVGMGAMLRFIFAGLASRTAVETFSALSGLNWPLFIAVISALTMTVGNFVALAQTNAKRMLAYSSIAHAGYILMGIPVLSVLGIQAILFYLVVYLIMNLGAFLSVIVLENRGIAPEIKNYIGLGARSPSVAVAFCVFLFSLTGIPPLAGLIGKVYLFAALIKGGIYWLAVVGVLNSVVSLYYYAGIVKKMFFERAVDETPIESVLVLRVILWILVIPTVLLGIYWKPLMEIAHTAASTFGL
jgi:NADH-quinone oxidoreductase subunit N